LVQISEDSVAHLEKISYLGSRSFDNLIVWYGVVAQLVEHLLCKQGVSGSIPLSSTKKKPEA